MTIEPASIQQFLQADIVKVCGPLLMDPSVLVRQAALGALRQVYDTQTIYTVHRYIYKYMISHCNMHRYRYI